MKPPDKLIFATIPSLSNHDRCIVASCRQAVPASLFLMAAWCVRSASLVRTALDTGDQTRKSRALRLSSGARLQHILKARPAGEQRSVPEYQDRVGLRRKPRPTLHAICPKQQRRTGTPRRPTAAELRRQYQQ